MILVVCERSASRVGAEAASRRASFARPGRDRGVKQLHRLTPRSRAGGLRCVMGRGPAGHPRVAEGPGRVAPAAGGCLRVVGPEALPAGGTVLLVDSIEAGRGGVRDRHRVGRVGVLLGGLITLAVTALVQIVIIPWVQARTRRRERWEKDVIELQTQLSFDLPGALGEAKIRGDRVRSLGMPDETSPDFEAAEKCTDDLLAQVHRLRILENRVRLERRQAIFWLRFGSRVGDVGMAVIEASVLFAQPDSLLADEPWQAAWTEAGDHLDRAADWLSLVSVPMVPPPTNRFQQWLFLRRMDRLHNLKPPSKAEIRQLYRSTGIRRGPRYDRQPNIRRGDGP